MDQAGPPSPQKQCAVIITTFFHTKPLCSHGHAWLHVRWRPSMSLYSSQSHTLSRALSRSTVLPPIQLCTHPFFSRCLHICVGEDICIPSVLLMHFCRWISGKCKPHAKWFTWQLIVCTHWPSKLLLFRFHHHRHIPCIQQWTLLCAVFEIFLSHSLQSRVRKWSEREWHNPAARINVSQVLCETAGKIKLDVCLGRIFSIFLMSRCFVTDLGTKPVGRGSKSVTVWLARSWMEIV